MAHANPGFRLKPLLDSGQTAFRARPKSPRGSQCVLTQVTYFEYNAGVAAAPKFKILLEEVERDILPAALEKNLRNPTRPAPYLGLSRNTLMYHMQKYNIGKQESKRRPGE